MVCMMPVHDTEPSLTLVQLTHERSLMSFALSQQQKLTQQLTMTPQMQQAMKILQLSRLELEQYVQTQMTENPLLEEKEYGPEEPLTKIERTTEDHMLEQLKNAGCASDPEQQEVDWEVMARQKEALLSHEPSSQTPKPHKDSHPLEQVYSATVTLAESLRQQIGVMDLSERQTMIANEIIGNLNEKGYLEVSLEELARSMSPNSAPPVSVNEAHEALKWVQKCEPTGVGSRDLMECLTIQMTEWNKENPHLIEMVKSQTKELQRKNYQQIAKHLKISLDEVDTAVAILTELEPIPARAFIEHPSPYISVDVSVEKIGGKWRVLFHDESLPNLTISSHYQDLIRSLGQDKHTKPTSTYLQEKLTSAKWVLKAIWKRQSTIMKVSQVIVAQQHLFFEKGPQHLIPMTLKDVAELTDVHESTVSRVTVGKYMQTPRGIFELRYFFNSSLASRRGNEVYSSESVREIIADLIAKENPKYPLSDQKIVEILTIKGISIARRTVAKYREQLAIPSSSQRRRFA